MNRPALPNMEDSNIRELALHNHHPVEIWSFTGAGSAETPIVQCEMCHQDWPCATREALIAWHRANPPRDARTTS